MIRIIKRNLTKKTLEEKDWNWHLACFHFKDYKNCYINGKPLKPYHILRNGDIIETVECPKGFTVGFFSFLYGALSFIGTTVSGGALTGAAAAVLGGIVVVGTGTLIAQGIVSLVSGRGGGGTTQAKEYSSATQPELRGASNDISDGVLPVLFGRTLQTPSYGQLPYRLVVDGSSTNKFRQYFIANYNNVVYSNYKLGETSVNNYSIDYLDILTASGSSNFIGFDNVKAENVDEELSYNADEEINQNAHYDYNETTETTSVKLNFVLQFSNVDINNWSNKKFRNTIRTIVNGAVKDFSKDITISASNLTKINNKTYIYNGSVTYYSSTTPISEIVYTNFAPLVNTRGNSTENTNELDCLYVSEKLVTDTLELEETLNLSINKYSGTVSEVVSTSPENTKEIDVIISFPQGLFKQENDGTRSARTVNLEIMYKGENDTYKPISQGTKLYFRDINGNKQPLSKTNTTVSGSKVVMHSPADMNIADQLFYRTVGFTLPKKGKYTVRVRSADFADKSNFDIGYPRCAEIQYYIDDKILDKSILPKVNQISFEAVAYKGLSGTLKKFNYIAEARIPVWNGKNWNTIDKSENPAAIIRYLLTDPKVNPRPISTEYIDNGSLVHLYEWCEQKGYKASGIVADSTKTMDVINEILKNCQGAMIPLLNGKHTFAIDGDEKVPKGLFNQHNSWDFSWSPVVGRLTEAIRVSFINGEDFTEDELTIYWYDGAVHENIKPGTTDEDYLLIKKEYKYVNDRQSVLNSVKYELECTHKKRNRFEFSVNLEALNMTLLDRVYISNSSNMQNESTGLIKNVITENDNISGFELYSDIEIPENAKIIIRSLDYENEQPLISIFEVLNTGKSNFVYINPVPYNEQIRGAGEIQGLKDKWHYDGDLFTLGQDTIYDCVITDIKYNEDSTATISARDY